MQAECFHFNDTLFQTNTETNTEREDEDDDDDDSTSGEDENIDNLKKEGQEGWMEKQLKEVREHLTMFL